MNERESLFRRLRAAAGEHTGGEDASAEASSGAGSTSDRVRGFQENFTAAGGLLFQGTLDSALPALAEALRTEGVTALFHPEGDVRARQVAEGLVPFGPFLLTTGASVRGGDTAVTAGCRTADAAIAETGTIVESSAGGKTLAPGLLADVHVAIVPASSIVATMEEALAAFTAEPPRNVSFLTGPSKTADIEQTLTTGAHGPKKAVALLLE